jgi:hypothetical protein
MGFKEQNLSSDISVQMLKFDNNEDMKYSVDIF